MRTIAVANQKGGVGKTITTLNLGAALLERDRRVLLVDLDPQASLTLALGLNSAQPTTVFPAIRRILAGEASALKEAVQETASGLPLIPSSTELSQAEFDLPQDATGLTALRQALASLGRGYDYALLDCPPSLSIITGNALVAASEVLIPLQTDYLALRGVDLLLTTLQKVKERANPRIKVLGIVLTMADFRTAHAREVVQAARAGFGQRVRVFETIIPLSVRVKEAPLTARSVLTYAPASTAAEAYRALAREIEL